MLTAIKVPINFVNLVLVSQSQISIALNGRLVGSIAVRVPILETRFNKTRFLLGKTQLKQICSIIFIQSKFSLKKKNCPYLS